MSVIPQLDNERINSLITSLDELARAVNVDELKFKRAENEAFSFTNIPALMFIGYTSLGTLASIKLNLEKTKQWFKFALDAATSEQMTYVQDNQMLSLQRVYQHLEVSQIAYQLHERYRDDIRFLDRAITSTAGIMHLSATKTLLERSAKLNHDPYSSPDYQANGNDSQEPSIQLLEELGLNESVLMDRIHIAAQFLLEQKVPHRGSIMNHLKTGEMSYQFIVQATPIRAAELSFDIASVIVDNFDDPLSDVLTISCVPHEHQAS